MQMYISKQFYYEYMNGNSLKVTIVGIMNDGYFKTQIEDDGEIWNSNMSYGELRHELKRGTITEIITK